MFEETGNTMRETYGIVFNVGIFDYFCAYFCSVEIILSRGVPQIVRTFLGAVKFGENLWQGAISVIVSKTLNGFYLLELGRLMHNSI